MTLHRPLPAFALLSLLLAACTTPGGTEEQLRSQVSGELRRAGVSDACIQSLNLDQLAQVRAFTNRPTGPRATSVLVRQQQIRTFVRRYCPEL